MLLRNENSQKEFEEFEEFKNTERFALPVLLKLAFNP